MSLKSPLLHNMSRRFKRKWGKKPLDGLTQAEVDEIDAVGEAWLKAENAARAGQTAASGSTTAGTSATPASSTEIKPTGAKGPLALIVGAIAATSLFATIPKDEGFKLAAYRDIAGIPTICYGDTRNVRMGMVETPEGCMRRLEAQLVAHAAPVMKCTPRLKEEGRDLVRAAAVSLAYNIGVRAYCRSTVDRRFDAGNWRGGCDAFLMWNKARVRGQLREVRGLTLRRQRERAHCLQGIT